MNKSNTNNNNFLVLFEKNVSLFSEVKNKQYLYTQGYYLLWNYGRIKNIFDINTKRWLYEEEKRAISFRYWLKVENPFPLNSKEWNDEIKIRKIDSSKKLQFDVKNYVFYLSILFNFFKVQSKFNFYTSPYLLNLFQNETDYIFDQKDYKEIFLKQNSVVLKKFDTLKKYINLNQDLLLENNNYSDYNSFIVNYNKNQSEIFPYLYMLPSFTDDVEFSDSFFKNLLIKYFSLTKLENWISNLTLGVKEFWLFFKIKFFFFNFSRFLKIIVDNKIKINYFFQNKINEKLLADEKHYLLSINNNIDPEGLLYLGDYNLWDYIFNDFFVETVDESFLFNQILEHYDVSFFYDLQKEDIGRFLFRNKDLIKDFKLDLFSIGLFHTFNNFINLKFIKDNISFLLLNDKEFVFKSNLFNIIKEDFFSNKFAIEYLEELSKNLEFNPSAIRTFLLEKTTNIKGRGLVRLYNSYILFLKKYFLVYLMLNLKIFKNNFSFIQYCQHQKVYDLYKNFSGSFFTTWFFFPFSDTFESDYENLFNEYLKIFLKEGVRSETNKYFVFRTSSSGFFKYSVDFSFKLTDSTDLVYLKNDQSFFNKHILYVKMLANLNKISNSLSNNEK